MPVTRIGRRALMVAGLTLLSVALVAPGASAAKAKTQRVSVRSNGAGANGESGPPSLSANGRFVAFASSASNLVGRDRNGSDDIFVHDRIKRKTTLVSRRTSGKKGNDDSGTPHISGSGRYVVFQSRASNLIKTDSNELWDIFIHDRVSGKTKRVNVGPAGAEATGGNSAAPSISANGQYVVFHSNATNLVLGDTNGKSDIFIRNRKTKTTRRVSIASDGSEADDGSADPFVSGDGRFVVFRSRASNLVPGDTNDNWDIFIRDRKKGTTVLVSRASDGTPSDSSSGGPAISANGRFVAFSSNAGNWLVPDANGISTPDQFIHVRLSSKTKLISKSSSGQQGNSDSGNGDVSATGRWLSFGSHASNLVWNDGNGARDVFLRDRRSGRTRLVSKSSKGKQGKAASKAPAISDDGRYVAFQSEASNLVKGDGNGHIDIFVRGPLR